MKLLQTLLVFIVCLCVLVMVAALLGNIGSIEVALGVALSLVAAFALPSLVRLGKN